jgi:methyl-accepting chemotaxis protein
MTLLASALSEGADGLATALVDGLGGAAPSLVLAFSSPAHPLADVLETLRARFPSAAILGASSAGEFSEGGDAKGSISAVAVGGDMVVHTGFASGLRADVESVVTRVLDGLPRSVADHPHCTAILLLDALSGVGEEAALLLAGHLGPDVQLAGGAAGDDLAMTKTVVAAGSKLGDDALALALVYTKKPLAIGVSHGHLPISDKLTVTRAEGNIVHEIDGRPAWDVWRERTREAAKAHGIDTDALTPEDHGAYLLRYEAGLALGGEQQGYKIRAPLAVLPGGALSFACGIPQGSVIRITESVAERQIDAALDAARIAKARLGAEACAGAVVFDCICRKLILDGKFEQAVRGMSNELGGARLAGFETYGEIALHGGEMSGFHNTTSVVLAFPR